MSLVTAAQHFAVPTAARVELQRVATHVLARRRFAVTGRFGLRPAPGGLATPSFEGGEVLRLSAGALLVERDGATRALRLAGASLAELATFAGADLATDFSAGSDSPPLGDVEAPLDGDPAPLASLGAWYALGARAIDQVVADAGSAAAPSVAQIWPEHFDLGSDLAWGPAAGAADEGHVAVDASGAGEGERVNLGASAGDDGIDEPYLYLGPWGAQRPGDPAFWNAPFGATLRSSGVESEVDVHAFLRRGLELLRAG